MIDLAIVINAIVKMGVKMTWDKAKRRESVIKLLKRFNLDPNNPPTNFDGIYTYTLIEYGINQPEPVLNFFRNKYIKEAFKQAFYEKDPSILNKEAEGIIEWNEETGKLGRIDYDPRREFAAFSLFFNKIVDRACTPAEVRRDQQLADVHQELSTLVERLDQLVTLKDVRSEATHLTLSNALDYLAHQMKSWFESLGYSFEDHEIWGERYFEWIIKVPAWRRYDLILIRDAIPNVV